MKVYFSWGLARWALSAQKRGEMSIRTALHRFVQNGRALLHSFRNTECFYSNFHQRNYHDKIHVVQVGEFLREIYSCRMVDCCQRTLTQLVTKTETVDWFNIFFWQFRYLCICILYFILEVMLITFQYISSFEVIWPSYTYIGLADKS